KVEEIINEKFQNLKDIFREVEQGIKYYLDGKTDILEYSKLKENIKILNRAFKDYLSGIIEDIISKYSYKIQNRDGNIFDLILFENKIYLISDKIEIYNYEGEKLEEMDKKDFWKILKEMNKLKITIDENVVKFLDKVFGKFTIYK
ncbi:MAG: hypothetical protein QXQ19_02515, partial [Candidatus Aenigmatarchaeota archaeon]